MCVTLLVLLCLFGTVLLVKQAWPQTASAPGPAESSYDLSAVDAGSESRQYQASSTAFSKYDTITILYCNCCLCVHLLLYTTHNTHQHRLNRPVRNTVPENVCSKTKLSINITANRSAFWGIAFFFAEFGTELMLLCILESEISCLVVSENNKIKCGFIIVKV